MRKQIHCPNCKKLCGEICQDEAVYISKINMMVKGAVEVKRRCPRCGTEFDMLAEERKELL